jgi:hypothetical protein
LFSLVDPVKDTGTIDWSRWSGKNSIPPTYIFLVFRAGSCRDRLAPAYQFPAKSSMLPFCNLVFYSKFL